MKGSAFAFEGLSTGPAARLGVLQSPSNILVEVTDVSGYLTIPGDSDTGFGIR